MDDEHLKLIFDHAFSVVLKANDFYGYACADATQIWEPGFPALLRLAKEYGSDGIHAAMCTASGLDPMKEWRTDELRDALESITPEERAGLQNKEYGGSNG